MDSKSFIIPFIIGIFTGIVLQVWILPLLLDPHPIVKITLDNKTDPYIVLVENKSDYHYKLRISTDSPIEDLNLYLLLPGVIKNNRESNSKTDCRYGKNEQGFTYEGMDRQLKGEKLIGQEQIEIQCQRMGSDGHYYLYFDLNETEYTPIYLSRNGFDPVQIPPFLTVGCSYYYKVRNGLNKNLCNVNATLLENHKLLNNSNGIIVNIT